MSNGSVSSSCWFGDGEGLRTGEVDDTVSPGRDVRLRFSGRSSISKAVVVEEGAVAAAGRAGRGGET